MRSTRRSLLARLRIAPACVALALAPGLLATSAAVSAAQEGPPGITVPTVLPAFNPDAPACKPPPGLQRALTFAQDNEREFMNG